MPKGVPKQEYTGEFKQMVVETMRKEKLSQYQVLSIENRLNEGRYVPVWEFIY